MGPGLPPMGGALPPPPPPPPLTPVGPQLADLQHLPPILTMARHANGWSSIENGAMISAKGYNVPVLACSTMADAFGYDQPDDRHFTCYAFRNRTTGEDEWNGVRMTQSGYALMRDVLAHPGQFPPAIESMCVSGEVVGNLLAVDYDLPDHGAWTPELIEQQQAMLTAAALRNPIIAQPSIAYMTRGGYRLVWLLSSPIPIEGRRGLVDLLPGLVASMHVAEIHVDPSCKDWTRVFRLPRVMREVSENGKEVLRPTSQASYLRQSWGCADFTKQDALPPGGQVLVWPPEAFKGISEFTLPHLISYGCQPLIAKYKHLIGQVPQMGSRASHVAIGDMPSDDVVGQLMGSDSSSSMIEVTQVHDWIKAAVKVTQKRPNPPACASVAYNHLIADKPIIDTLNPNVSGQLHAGITSLAMAVMRTLRTHLRHDSARPQVLYAMILQAARRANKLRTNPRPDGELCNEVWSLVTWGYRTEMGVLEEVEETERQEREAETIAAQVQTHNAGAQEQLLIQAIGRMITKEPTEDPLAPPNPEQYEWLRQHWKSHLVLVLPKYGYSVLRIHPNGRIGYDMPVEGLGSLLTRVRNCGHEHVTVTQEGSKPGKLVARPEHEIIADYGSVVDRVIFSRLVQHNELGVLLTAGAPELTFTKALPGMNLTIQPRFDPDVHEWLTALGGDRHEDLFDWLAAAWDLTRPATILHIEGRTDSGKSLIIKGLQACTVSKQTAAISAMFGDFQDQALQTPLLVADEEHSNMGKMSRSAVNVLKKLATGEASTINAKGKAEVQLKGFWRVIMVENGMRMLHFTEDMSPSDKAALMNRLLCVKADGERCRAVLDRIGGRQGVESWLAYKLPQHLRFLSIDRKLSQTERVLAASKTHQQETALMIGTNTMAKIVSALGTMMTDRPKWGGQYAFKDNDMIVSAKTIKNVMMEECKASGAQMPAPQSVTEAIKTLSGRPKGTPVRVGKIVEWAWPIPLSEIIPRLIAQGEHLDIREAISKERWDALVPADVRQEYETAETMQFERKPVTNSAAGSKSLGDHMRATAAAAKAALPPPPPPPLPMPPVLAGQGPGSLFSIATLPPPPPTY